MRLIDLDPQWILGEGGKRIGFTFVSPTKAGFRQSCFPVPPSNREQWDIWEDFYPNYQGMIQGCNPSHRWTIAGGIENASFETMTVTPSLDGSAGGLWHGFITDGNIVGGI